MGRPYADELAILDESYSAARAEDIAALTESIGMLRARPLVVIGSGGSTTACHLVARLHETYARLPARVLTPLEFLQNPVLDGSAVLLLSASGANPDILAAARHAVLSEVAAVVALCTQADTPLRAQLGVYRHTAAFEFAGPSRKDGFLATNSLLLSCALLTRAYGIELPTKLPALAACTEPEPAVAHALLRPSTIALASGWAVPAAIDLESKWSEAGFGSVTVTDARNFAHGRHHGLSRRLAETLVLGVSTPKEAGVLERTLARLPQTARTTTIHTPLVGPAGALDLVVRVLRLTGAVGQFAGLDPGRPRVPTFGRALYHARLPRELLRLEDEGPPEDLWIRRKVSPAVWANATEEAKEHWRARCRAWVATAESTRIGAVVFDYDGTLCEADERFTAPAAAVGEALTRLIDQGMCIGVATGRGDSIVEALRAVLPERVWARVLVGMYNGGVLFRLHQAPPSWVDCDPVVEQAHAILAASPVVGSLAKLRSRPTQVTVIARSPLPEGLLRRFVVEALNADPNPPAVDVFASGHSVDVIGRTVSKQRVVEVIRQDVLRDSALGIMTIGDQGQAGGNDAPFLAHALGLSVEHASSTLESCWNVAPRGSRWTAAMLRYLVALSPARDFGFRFSVRAAAGLGRRSRRPDAAAPKPLAECTAQIATDEEVETA